MISSTLALTLGFLVLLALSGTFSGSETALFSLDRIERRRLERSPSRRDRLAAGILARPERLLAGILLGNTLVNVAASSVMLAITRRVPDRLFGLDPVVASVILATGAVLVLGEIVPKGIAVHWPARSAPAFVTVLAPLLRVISPAARLLERMAFALLGALRVREESGSGAIGRRELQLLFEDMRQREGITEGEGEIASNIFEFFETRAREIMTPRVDLVAVPVELSREELRRRLVAARHSRIPVYRGDLDQIIGFLNTKESLLEPDLPLDALLHPVHFVPERARIQRVLSEVQARRLNVVVVVNEYGGTAGIITKEDLVETVVGEIFDEQERDESPPLVRVSGHSWRVDGLLPLDDLAEEIPGLLSAGPAQTVAGHVAHILGRPPRPGDSARDGGVGFRVLQVRRHRAHRVLVTVLGDAEEPRT